MDPGTSAASLVGAQIGSYRLARVLGEGAMGAVYLGEHLVIAKRVAIKVLHETLTSNADVVSRFFTEAKALNAIAHPYIVEIIDVGQTTLTAGGRAVFYLIMEFLEGETLRARMRRRALDSAEAIAVILQAADALGAAHARGVVHRDLKPDNIMLTARPGGRLHIKLLDFGIAKMDAGGGADHWMHKTRTGAILGTPAYMAPEQCSGSRQVDHRVDVYALGMMLYELLCGRPAFQANGFGDLLVAQLTQAPPSPRQWNPTLGPDLEALILRCLAKDPAARFQTMSELSTVLAGIPLAAHPGAGDGVWLHRPAAAIPRSTADMPTTLGGTTGETQVPAPAAVRGASRAIVLVGAIGVALLLVAVGGYALWARKPVAPVTPATSPTPPPKETASVARLPEDKPSITPAQKTQVRIDSQPSGATVARGQTILGTTPFDLPLTRGEPPTELAFTRPGYQTVRYTVTSEDTEMRVILTPKITPPSRRRRLPRPTSDASEEEAGELMKPSSLP